MTIEERTASLLAFLEERDRQTRLPFDRRPDSPPSSGGDCGRQDGGRFASGNDCAADDESGSLPSVAQTPSPRRLSEIEGAGRTTTATGFPPAWKKAEPISHKGGTPGLEKIKSISVDKPRVFTAAAKEMGFKSVSDVAKALAANSDGAKIEIEAENGRTVRNGQVVKEKVIDCDATIPIPVLPDSGGSGSATVKVDLHSLEDGAKRIHYNLFQVSDSVKAQIAKEKSESQNGESRTETLVSSKIIDLMLDSLEAAEKAGFTEAYTLAAGSATDSMFKGYRLWGRFGMDGEIGRHPYGATTFGKKLAEYLAANPDSDVLTPAARHVFETTGELSLQQMLFTKAGEKYWKQNGGTANLTLDFTNKESLGYKKYRKFLDMRNRARERGSRDYRCFLSFVSRSSLGVCPSQWPGFKIAEIEARVVSLREFLEERNCGTGAGGFQKGNTCAGGLAADVATGAAKGAVVGGINIVSATATPLPEVIAVGAAAGAVVGAVKGVYDNKMRPTRAARAIKAIGSSDEKIASLVKDLGGSPKSVAEASGRSSLTIAIKDDSGKKKFEVTMTKGSITISPSKSTGRLSKSEVSKIKKIAEENSDSSVRIIAKNLPTSTLSKLTKAGAKLAVDAAVGLVVGWYVPLAATAVGAATEAIAGEVAADIVMDAVANFPTIGLPGNKKKGN